MSLSGCCFKKDSLNIGIFAYCMAFLLGFGASGGSNDDLGKGFLCFLFLF